jgi:4-alpha-glucanotransferase
MSGRLEADGPLFPVGYRASGILLDVTSLLSRYGMGDLGPSDYQWIDRLREAAKLDGRRLPLGPGFIRFAVGGPASARW